LITASGVRLYYERSARRDATYWMMLLVGAMFIFAGYTIDPSTNCDEAGNCAPWLVPVAGIMGWGATAIALGQLIVNPSRGYQIDPASDELTWWKNRTLRVEGDTGRIHTSRIASIRLHLRDENDSVSLFDDNGERLHYFDEEVIPWPYDSWARRFQQLYPHIQIDDA